jgi:hypothetical protein
MRSEGGAGSAIRKAQKFHIKTLIGISALFEHCRYPPQLAALAADGCAFNHSRRLVPAHLQKWFGQLLLL